MLRAPTARRVMTLIEVMLAALVLTLVLSALLGSQILAMKTQRNAAYAITLYALSNSICDQVCGLGYEEVNATVIKGGTQVVALNDPATGKQIPLRLQFGKALQLNHTGSVDLRLKTDYSVHDGALSGMDRLFTDATITGQRAAENARYASVQDLSIQINATRVAGLNAYTVTARAAFIDAFGHPASVSVSRFVSNLSGYAQAH
jgi:hypothetical protein